MRSYKGYLIMMILALALIGLTFELVSNPIGLLTRILIGIGIITIFVFIFRFIMAKRMGGSFFSTSQHTSPRPTRAQLAKAKRTSQGKRKPSPPVLLKRKDDKSRPARAINRKKTQHLTVIEGKKNKKKSRALF